MTGSRQIISNQSPWLLIALIDFSLDLFDEFVLLVLDNIHLVLGRFEPHLSFLGLPLAF